MALPALGGAQIDGAPSTDKVARTRFQLREHATGVILTAS